MRRANTDDIALLWHRCAQITRGDVFGGDDPLRPHYEQPGAIVSQIDIPALGTVGSRYEIGSVALVSVNPAGGKATAVSAPDDRLLYDAFAQVRDAKGLDAVRQAFALLNGRFAVSIQSWSITRQHIAPILDALGRGFEDVCYLYLVPFRTKEDAGSRMPGDFTLAGYEKHLRHQLQMIQPRLLVAVDRPSERYCRVWAGTQEQPPEIFYYTRKRDAHAERKQLLRQLERYREA